MRFTHLLILVVCLASLPFAMAGEMSKEDMYVVFNDANKEFTKANELSDDPEAAQEHYQQAILGYKKLIDAGEIHNSKLYYNLANSYLLTDDIGRAILNYRKAQKLDSSDPDIYKNLSFARSKRENQFAVTAQKKVLERLFFWHYDFSLHTRFLIGGVCFALFCTWLAIKQWAAKWPAAKPVCIITMLIVVCMLASVAIEQYSMVKNRSGVIVADTVVARQGDGSNYPESFDAPLTAGIEFDLIEQRPGWFNIKLPNGQQTWIPDDSAELI